MMRVISSPLASSLANVDNQQNDSGIGVDTSRSNRMPALLSHLVYAVCTYQAAFVFEDKSCHLE